ncbi:MAG: acetate--CoA ligase family protein [Deltaproteobacteria bacterium]|nr:acetate--CoA ligase family protein [Deltaproteobacteria bacterium]
MTRHLEDETQFESLDAILTPQSIALFGASNQEGKVGYVCLKNLLGKYKGKIYPIHPHEKEILGVPAFPDLKSVPGPIDLAFIIIPAESVVPVIEQCGQKKIKAAIVITAGFAEAGAAGKALQDQLAEKARQYGVLLVWPSCFGILNCNIGLNASIAVLMPEGGGKISFVVQSGAYGMAVCALARDHHLKVSKIIGLGNKCDIKDDEVLRYLAQDPETEVIALYLESIEEESAFFAGAERLSRRKPIVVCKQGRTPEGRRAIQWHTATPPGSFASQQALLENAGMIRVANGVEMVEVAKALAWQPLPSGNRVAIVTNSGGTAVELTDFCAEHGLSVPELSVPLQDQLQPLVPAYATVKNPVDMTTIWPRFVEVYPKCIEAFYESPEIDIIVPIMLHRSAMMREVSVAVRDAVHRCQRERGIRKPTYICWASSREFIANMEILESAQIPCFEWPEQTSRVVGLINKYAQFLRGKG